MIRVELFIDEIYDFLRTVTIKNTYIEDNIKSKTISLLGIDFLDQRQNPYFHNLLGEYGPHDELMFINSLDDGTEILFSKVNLELHPKTKFAYSVYTRYYKQIELKYPTQTDLIKSIRYPVDPEVIGIGLYETFHTPMFVTSLDNGAQVLFDINLKDLHPITWDAYIVHSSLYNALIAQYNQEDLLTDIRYPGLTHVINAELFELLNFDENQLETNEVTSILDAIKDQLEYYRIRWNVKEYAYEEYYPTVLWSIVWNTLPNVILNQRVRNLRTSSVHSAYIWEFLTSKGLGDYRSILDREQQLFLYKNINYILRNRGKDGNLFILADRLLAPRNVTLDSKSIVLNTEGSETLAIPTAEIISSDTRDITTPSQDAEAGFETVEELFAREFDNGLEPFSTPGIIADHKQVLSYSKVSWLPTKLVELNATDLFNSTADFYIKFALETIAYRISRNELNYNVVVTNDEELSFTAEEAFALAYYAIQRQFEQTITVTAANITSSDQTVRPEDYPIQLSGLTVIHNGIFVQITEINKASFVGEEVIIRRPLDIPTDIDVSLPYLDIIPPVSQDFFYTGKHYEINKHIDTDYILNNVQQNVGSINSSLDLLTLIDGQFKIKNRTIDVARTSGNLSDHLSFDLLNEQLSVYGSLSLNLGIGFTTFEEWFDSNLQLRDLINSLELKSDVKVAYSDLANDLLSSIIPIEDSTAIIFNTFTANDFELMKQLFIQLCSYNITFLETSAKDATYYSLDPIVINDDMDRVIDATSILFMDDVEFSSYGDFLIEWEKSAADNVFDFGGEVTLDYEWNPIIEPEITYTVTSDIQVPIIQTIEFDGITTQGSGYE